MDNSKLLQEVLSDSRVDDVGSALDRVPAVDDATAHVGISPLVFALVFLATSTLGGFVVGVALGPATFMVMR